MSADTGTPGAGHTRDALDEVFIRVLLLLLALCLCGIVVVWVVVTRCLWGRAWVLLARFALPVVLRLWRIVWGWPNILVVRGEKMEAGKEVVGACQAWWGLWGA